MCCSWWLVGLLALPLQVPPPAAGEDVSSRAGGGAAGDPREGGGRADGPGRSTGPGRRSRGRRAVRARLPRPSTPDGADPVRPPARRRRAPRGPSGQARPDARLDEILGALGGRVVRPGPAGGEGDPPRYALAGACLREVVDRQPDHRRGAAAAGLCPVQGRLGAAVRGPAVREGVHRSPRLRLGQGRLAAAPRAGRAADPAVRAARSAGSRPPRPTGSGRTGSPPGRSSPSTSRSRPTCRSPRRSASAAASRPSTTCSWRSWPMSRATTRRWPADSATRRSSGEPATKRHVVYYFASKERISSIILTPEVRARISTQSLGFYDPPKSSTGPADPAYFFRDPDGRSPRRPPTSTTRSRTSSCSRRPGPTHYTRNFGNYWVFEGLGTYFETVEPQPDGSLEVGGPRRAPDGGGDPLAGGPRAGRSRWRQFVALRRGDASCTTTARSTSATSRRWP